ncbi:MAG: hypothetical protein GY778_01450 [bacterium]|nr:hypothetical protein [bacterium]
MYKRLAVLASLFVLTMVPLAEAQVLDAELSSNAVWETTSAGGRAARSPGSLVNSGIARFNDAQAFAFSPPEITQTEEEMKIVTQLKIQSLQIMFDYVNTALLALDNALRAQAGFAPYVPNPIRPDGGSGIDLGGIDISSFLRGTP